MLSDGVALLCKTLHLGRFMTVKNKFRLFYSVLSILLLFMLAFSVLMFYNYQTLEKTEQRRYRSLQLAVELRESTKALTEAVRAYASTGDSLYEKSYQQILDVYNGKAPRKDGRTIALRELFKELGVNQKELAKLDEADNFFSSLVWTDTIVFHAVKGLFPDKNQKFTIKRKANFQLANAIVYSNVYKSARKKILKPVDQFSQMVNKRTNAELQKDSKQTVLWMSGTIITVFVIIAIVITSYFAGISPIIRSLGGEPQEMVQISQAIADGNLNKMPNDRRKLEGIYEAMHKMNYKLRDILEGTLTASNYLISSSQHLDATADVISQGASEQAAFTEEIAAVIEKIFADAEKNSSDANKTKEVAQEISSVMQTLNEEIHSTASEIEHISEKIEIINSIAQQSNILALNASVEAARAGEHGKGFAVVASEVQKLAENSRLAAQEISEMAVKNVASVKGNREKIAFISSKILSTGELISEIASSSVAQSESTREIKSSILELSKITQQNAASSEELSASASEFRENASKLQSILSYFKI